MKTIPQEKFNEAVKVIQKLPDYKPDYKVVPQLYTLRKMVFNDVFFQDLPKKLLPPHSSPVTVFYDSQSLKPAEIPATLHDSNFLTDQLTRKAKHRLLLASKVSLYGDGTGRKFSSSHFIALLTCCAISLSKNSVELPIYCISSPKEKDKWAFQEDGLIRYQRDMYKIFKSLLYSCVRHNQSEEPAVVILPFIGDDAHLNGLDAKTIPKAQAIIHLALCTAMSHLSLLKSLKIVYSLPPHLDMESIFSTLPDNLLICRSDIFLISRILYENGLSTLLVNLSSNFSIGGSWRNLRFTTLEEIIFTLTNAVQICTVDHNSALNDEKCYEPLPLELNAEFFKDDKHPILVHAVFPSGQAAEAYTEKLLEAKLVKEKPWCYWSYMETGDRYDVDTYHFVMRGTIYLSLKSNGQWVPDYNCLPPRKQKNPITFQTQFSGPDICLMFSSQYLAWSVLNGLHYGQFISIDKDGVIQPYDEKAKTETIIDLNSAFFKIPIATWKLLMRDFVFKKNFATHDITYNIKFLENLNYKSKEEIDLVRNVYKKINSIMGDEFFNKRPDIEKLFKAHFMACLPQTIAQLKIFHLHLKKLRTIISVLQSKLEEKPSAEIPTIETWKECLTVPRGAKAYRESLSSLSAMALVVNSSYSTSAYLTKKESFYRMIIG